MQSGVSLFPVMLISWQQSLGEWLDLNAVLTFVCKTKSTRPSHSYEMFGFKMFFLMAEC